MLYKIIQHKFLLSIALVIAFYISGIIGIATKAETIDFLSLTPLHLLIILILLLLNHQNFESKQWIVFLGIAVAGFFIEVLGVNTGVIFGNYEYGKTLGFKLFGTPLIIGANWLVLVYSVVYTFGNCIKNRYLLAACASAILVFLDFFIEPVAIAFDFWHWNGIDVPIRNYVAWYIISFVFCILIVKYKKDSKNKLATYLLFFQFLFFGFFYFYNN